MRNQSHQSSQGTLKSPTNEGLAARHAAATTRIGALTAPAVDEALADDATLASTAPMKARRGSRRELVIQTAEIERRIVDDPHPYGAAVQNDSAESGGLLQRLAQQLSSLQAQQDQIRRLLEQAEQFASVER